MGEPDFSRMSPAAIARAQGLHPSRLPEPSVRPGAVTVLAWRAPKLPAPARRRPDQTPTADAPVDVERVLAAIRSASGLTHEELRARSRQRRLARWRHCAYALLRERCGLTLPEIGALLGRDHTGVLYGLRSWKARSAQPEKAADALKRKRYVAIEKGHRRALRLPDGRRMPQGENLQAQVEQAAREGKVTRVDTKHAWGSILGGDLDGLR